MFQNPLQFRVHAIDSTHRNAQFAVVKSACPGRRLGNVSELFLSVENHNNVLARLVSQLAREVGELLLQGIHQLLLQVG